MSAPQNTCTIKACQQPARAKGMCWTHYGRQRTHGDPLAAPKRFNDARDALASRPDRNGPVPEHRPDLGPCWVWPGADNGKYGLIKRNGRMQYVHRVSYELHVGPIPDGLVIDHLCRNRKCCNPVHLEPVTNRENLNRGARWPKRAEREARILAYLLAHPDSTARQLVTVLNDSRGAIFAVLRRMETDGQLTSQQLKTVGYPRAYRLRPASRGEAA